MATNRQSALDSLAHANDRGGEAQPGDYPAVMALVGIGHALLDVADAIREQTDLIRRIDNAVQGVEDVEVTGDQL